MRGGQSFQWVSDDEGIVDRRLQNKMGPEGIWEGGVRMLLEDGGSGSFN